MKRRGLLVLAVAAIAAAVACLVTALQPVSYTGSVELVVGRGNAPLDPRAPRDAHLAKALRELVESHVLAAQVIRSMQLDESQDDLLARMTVETPQPAVLRISIGDANGRRATLAATTTALVFIRLVGARFGTPGAGEPVRATIWDPAHATREDRIGKLLDRGLLAAVVAGIAALGLLRLPLRPSEALPGLQQQTLAETAGSPVAQSARPRASRSR